MWNLIGPAGTFVIIVVILIVSGIKILKEYERGRHFSARPHGFPSWPRHYLCSSPGRENGSHRSPDAYHGHTAAGCH